jgi:hypothetical protein
MTEPDYIERLRKRRDDLLQQVYKITVDIAQWERMIENADKPIELTPWDMLSIRAQNCAYNENLVEDRKNGTPNLEMLKSYPLDQFAKLIPNCGKKTALELKEWALAILAEGGGHI